jgi:hypothetical protein
LDALAAAGCPAERGRRSRMPPGWPVARRAQRGALICELRQRELGLLSCAWSRAAVLCRVEAVA